MKRLLVRLRGLIGLGRGFRGDAPSATTLCPNCGRENSVYSLVCGRCEKRLPRIAEFRATTLHFYEQTDFLEMGVEDVNGFGLNFEHYPEEGSWQASFYEEDPCPSAPTAESGLSDVQACVLSRERLSIEFCRLLNRLEKNYAGLEVQLELTDPERESLAAGLRKLFSERPGVLTIESRDRGWT